jgi:hypothetical protein
MTRTRPIAVAIAALACWMLACSSDEGVPKPVPVDSGTDAPAADGAAKGDAGVDHASPEGGAH